MSTQQIIVFIGMVVFIAFGIWLQFRMKFDIKANEQEDNKKLHEWIKAHPDRSDSLGYTHKEEEVKEE